MFSAIILTVWLPGNLLADFLQYYVFGEEEIFRQMRVTMWIEGIFGPIYIGAMVYALSRLKQGQEVAYGEAMAVGLKNWGRLFAARFVAGLIIILGLIALVVPGILFLLRYAFLDCAVVLEGTDAGQARVRSTKLTQGMRGQIFLAAVVFFIGFSVLSFLLYLPQAFADQLNVLPFDVVVDCLLDIAFAVLQVTIFLYYWEAKTNEQGEAGPTPVTFVDSGSGVVA